MTLVLNCEIKPLCYPKAALFCFASALMSYNAFAMMKGAFAAEHGRHEREMLSHYYIALEINEATDGMLVVLPEIRWQQMEEISNSCFASEMRSITSKIDLSRYRKSVRGPKKPPPKRTNKRKSVHVSTKQILDKRKKKSC